MEWNKNEFERSEEGLKLLKYLVIFLIGRAPEGYLRTPEALRESSGEFWRAPEGLWRAPEGLLEAP
jgi:hypothetical protein